jgi:putative nucleotidyltransferase with HDIG domain
MPHVLQVVTLAVLLVAISVSELLGVLFPNSMFIVSMSFPLGIAVAAYFGPAYGALAAVFEVVPLLTARPRPSWDRMLYNLAQFALTLIVAGWLFQSVSGSLLISVPAGSIDVFRNAMAAAVAVAVGIAINSGLVAVGVRVLYEQPMRKTLAEGLLPMIPSQFMLGFVGVLLAQVAAAIGPTGLGLFVVPLLVARQTYERTIQLRAAYADTIASLVAALEAKDVYTKGHSVRVAKYACAIARQLGVTDARVERLEWAALLHDIGKVGISRRVLSKNDKLSNEEYTEIKKHPAIGARILEGVPYLADLVPSIEAHHERLDGSGYGSGASGDDIPLEARILAVADAYDAMTSTRPYRTAMPHEAAVGELERGRSTQFDGTVVDAFLRAFDEPGLLEEAATS